VSDYCECDYDGWSTEFYSSGMVRRSRKQHRCSECGGPVFIGESYQRSVGKFDGDLQTHVECVCCMEIRQWAEISVPCFCAAEWGSLIERVKYMVEDVVPTVEGFDHEWDQRRYQLKLRRMAATW
jgi:hypothetical protein